MINKIKRIQNRKENRRQPIERQAAFLEFKQTELGKEIESNIKESRNALKESRKLVKDKTEDINAVKRKIDHEKEFLD